MPGAENNPSPDKDVWVLTSQFASDKDQAKNTAHEGYGHAYIYEQTRDTYQASHHDDNLFHITGIYETYVINTNGYLERIVYPNPEMGKGDRNLYLQFIINQVENETINNYEENSK